MIYFRPTFQTASMVKNSFDLNVKKQRSHSGCVRCKRRRQKCDEQKPRCCRCNDSGIACEYSVQLKWGGRTFDRSRFGTCLKDVKKINSITDGFVYAVSSEPHYIREDVMHTLPTEPQYLPSLSVTERSLLSHFTYEASRVTCCHANIQAELCRLIIPMAVDVPSLMYATLAWAALHSVSFNRNLNGVSDPMRLISSLKTKSIQHLRSELQELKGERGDAVLATVRTLCQCEIHSGSDSRSSWRVHVKGAKALMSAIKWSNNPRSRLLSRWYASLESLAALTPSVEKRGVGSGSSLALSEELPESVYLDDYNGYSTDLSLTLGKIGAAAELCGIDREVQADQLENKIYCITERDNNTAPVFYPGVVENLSLQDIADYSLCNQAYQYTALIHIQRRLRNCPSDTSSVQNSVKRIIECASAMTATYGLSPAIVMTTPLFTAGCEALGKDRETIRMLLKRLFNLLKIRNIQLSLDVLESHWAAESDTGNWRSFLHKKDWDFIPY